jgi:hypothetical protein
MVAHVPKNDQPMPRCKRMTLCDNNYCVDARQLTALICATRLPLYPMQTTLDQNHITKVVTLFIPPYNNHTYKLIYIYSYDNKYSK